MIRRAMIAVLALSGCATAENHDGVLYRNYARYGHALLDGTAVARRQEFFAPAILDELQVNSKAGQMVILFGKSVAKEQSHYEKAGSDRGCLTVNGYERSGDPVTLFIEYQVAGPGWLIGNLKTYVQEKSEFSGFFDEALCPAEAQVRIESAFEKRTQTQ
jgi:hypothetical protein